MDTVTLKHENVDVTVSTALLELPILSDILSVETWRDVLNEEERESLKGYLPPGCDPEAILMFLTSNENFSFSNPLKDFIKDAQAGKYSVAKETTNDDITSLPIEGKQVEPSQDNQAWHTYLDKELPVVARQQDAILANGMNSTPPDSYLIYVQQQRIARRQRIQQSAERRFQSLIKKRDRVPDRLYNYQHRRWVNYQDMISVWEAALHQDTIFPGKSNKTISTSHFNAMIREHKQKAIETNARPYIHALPVNLEMMVQRKIEGMDCNQLLDILPQRKHLGCFFFLLYQILKAMPLQRAPTSQLKRFVQSWMKQGRTEKITLNRYLPWEHQRDWSEYIVSSLSFLSKPYLGQPALVQPLGPISDDPSDHSNDALWWQWLGPVNSCQSLMDMQEAWPDHLAAPDTLLPSTPAGQDENYTHYRVRPITSEEQKIFHIQERERFSRPDKPFIYRMHGYESHVAPVKGCSPETMPRYHNIQPRKHNSLISDRPPWVTAQALVRDAVARLPNGVGIRNDVLELLKYSQYFAPGVTDDQLHVVASGGLDRMSTEPEPCVRFDQEKKHWVYLHKHRYTINDVKGPTISTPSSNTSNSNLPRRPLHKIPPSSSTPGGVSTSTPLSGTDKVDAEQAKKATNHRADVEPPSYYRRVYSRLTSEMVEVFGDGGKCNVDTESEDDISIASSGRDTDYEVEVAHRKRARVKEENEEKAREENENDEKEKHVKLNEDGAAEETI